jgi:HD superfamily phosphohydrolase
MFSDPVHGFISVPKKLLLPLIETPEVQRLRRIRQLGLGDLVFAGAEHTRFGHALGAMALMQESLQHLADKGTPISEEEYEAALAAALLHDIGHAPFSHTLEHELFSEFHHEQMSRALICDINERFGDTLSLALRIFDNEYERPFFHQLVAGQLDVDRLDYLRRDSFYTGVAEGVVGVERLIKTLRVHPLDGGKKARLMSEMKGIYAVENFLLARRMMYWQVYLHKTVLAADFLLRSILARYRTRPDASAAPALDFFLRQNLTGKDIGKAEVRHTFCQLDDIDVVFSIKQWMHDTKHPILANLSQRFINRQFPRVTFLDEAPSETQLETWRNQVADWLIREGLATAQNAEEIVPHYFLSTKLEHKAYGRLADSIQVIDREDKVKELSAISDSAIIREISKSQVKFYICHPKEISPR